MSTDPRAALDRLVAALEAHLLAAGQRRGERDPGVEAAYRTLADAFETYDEALYDAYDEITPFVLYDDVEDEREDSDDDEDDDSDDDEDDDSDDDEDSDDESLPIDDLTDVEGDHDDEAAQDEDDYEFEPRRSPDTSSRA